MVPIHNVCLVPVMSYTDLCDRNLQWFLKLSQKFYSHESSLKIKVRPKSKVYSHESL